MNKQIAWTALAVLMLVAPAAMAEYSDDEGKAFGFRVGYGAEPDQFVFGLQADMGPTYGRLHFVPSIDVGLGSEMTTMSLNSDFKIFMPLPNSSLLFYGLAGPTLSHWILDEAEDDTEIGFSLGAGARVEFGDIGWYNLEARFGTGDIPELRIMAGLLFGSR
ncbi:MAG: outer membrane beta-barrel protein [bacterium]|nr:outer membrane beta-barrel protein [bacterium]